MQPVARVRGPNAGLRDHALFWLERRSARIWLPRFLQHVYEDVAEIEHARPGFAAALRELAREHLGAADPDRVWQAVAALAVVGERADVPLLQAVASGNTRVAMDARTAIFEIQHRPPAT